MNKYTDLEALERLCILVEEAGVDIAPNFDQYTDMAFAIANALGEAGRDCFHRLCALCPKYQTVKADKLFTDAIAKGRGANGLGTVFYLAEQAGINLGDLKGFSSIPQSSLSQPHKGAGAGARTYYMQQGHYNQPSNAYNEAFSSKPAFFTSKNAGFPHGLRNNNTATSSQENTLEELPFEAQHASLPGRLPSHQWPHFLQQIIDCGEGQAQQDMLFCGSVAALGATITRFTYVSYSNNKQYPNLQVFVIAPAASGKGAISWIRKLVMPFHKEKIARYEAAKAVYQKEMQAWINEGKKREESTKPAPPKLELFFIAGNNSGTGIQENIIDNDGFGLILEPEADVLSSAIQAEYGQWSHLLRKAHDHEFLSYNRRKDHEYRECDLIRLTVLICGTPNQLVRLIPDAENGLFSRQLFYYMPPLNEFVDMFPKSGATTYDERFTSWGNRWKQTVDALQKSVSYIEFVPTPEQRDKILDRMAQLFRHATVAHGDSMRSSVVRLAPNLLRIMNVVALIRALDSLLTADAEEFAGKLQNMVKTLLECPGITPADNIPAENVKDGIISSYKLSVNDDDFEALLALAEPFYRHAEHALQSMPQEATDKRNMTPQERFLGDLPMEFTRQEALAIADKYELTAKQCEYNIKKLLEKGSLERLSRGTYRYIGEKAKGQKDEKGEVPPVL